MCMLYLNIDSKKAESESPSVRSDKSDRIAHREKLDCSYHAWNTLRSVQSDVFYCWEDVDFLFQFDLLSNMEGGTEQSTSLCTVSWK